MKKTLLSALVLSSLVSGYVAAAPNNTGQVNFIGSVTSTTCNINAVVNGAVKDTIDLGTVDDKQAAAVDVPFSLVPDSAACLAKTKATVGWQSSAFTTQGLGNATGTAKGVSIQLTAVNSKVANENVTYNQQNNDFDVTGGIKSFDYKAKMVKAGSGVAAGTVLSTASYAVAYN